MTFQLPGKDWPWNTLVCDVYDSSQQLLYTIADRNEYVL